MVARAVPQGSGNASRGFWLKLDMTDSSRDALPAPPILTSTHAVFLDFDGTLAPLQDDPNTVALPAGGSDVLKRIAELCDGALAVVSGRDIRDLSSRVPSNLWRAGGHGIEVCAPTELPSDKPPSAPLGLAERLEEIAVTHPGTWLERKGTVFAVHYRAIPDAELPLASALESILHTLDAYKLQRGKMIFELKPANANKGRALASLMASAPFIGRVPVMVGDDATDEDAMQAAIDLGGFGVKAGDGDTLATYRLQHPSAVWNWLKDSVA